MGAPIASSPAQFDQTAEEREEGEQGGSVIHCAFTCGGVGIAWLHGAGGRTVDPEGQRRVVAERRWR
jgi:hypothetical protein